MRTLRTRTMLGLAVMLLLPALPLFSANPKEQRKELQQQNERVTKVLRGEAMGSKLDRQQYFESLLSGELIADPVYWQAGYVRQGERWVPHDRISLTSQEQEALKEYSQHREQFWGNDEEHFQIAQWCLEKGLPEQARAHLMAVLLNHPDHEKLRRTLGYQRVGGDWMNAAEYALVAQEYDRLQANLQAWSPEVVRIRDGFDSGNPLKIRQAAAALSKVTDPDAVPALDLILLPHSELCARQCIDQLAVIRDRDATLSLCRTALQCPWRNVSEQALAELKTRSWEDYVPAMLAGTRKNHSISMQMYWNDPLVSARGFMAVATVKTSSEGFTQIDHRIHQHGLQFIAVPAIGRAVWNIPRVFDKAETFSGLDHHFQLEIGAVADPNRTADFEISALDSTRATLQSLEQQELADRDFNDRVVMLMSRVVPGGQFESIDQVWSWWNQTMELGIDRDSLEQRSQVVEVSEDTFVFTIASCFTAGTPVWSEFGSRPIESLKVGDRVLTKHVETGELTYRPVIRTTYRETNQPLIQLRIGDEKITATGGHLFWVSGSGWKKARDLKPGHRIHTVTGTVEVAGIEEVPTEPTFNLVVDGFHTYFVGNGKALCHDVSLASPTDAVVPGLVD